MAATFKRILVANRGEIAVRVIRACHQLGIEAFVAVSEADRESLAARIANRAICVGPPRSADSYLRPEVLVMAALGSGCQAIHPGYGFLSERAAFARMCADAGLIFIGPPADAIQSMGDKISAVRLAEEAGVPRVPGLDRVATVGDACRIAADLGYPVLLKAAAGGGGRGMRIVRSEGDMAVALESAAAEALGAFGDATLYIEKLIERARHVEIQILGDAHGNVIHLGERDCSTQRRQQKLIEEAPSPIIDEELRNQLGAAATNLARRIAYQNAGTVEFILDESTRHFYFLEMNTRIQVEHPVTEMVTGRDLVVEQIRIAAGDPISFRQEDVRISGHAIECRINAEDVARNFAPSPGRVTVWSTPNGEGVRLDSHCYAGYLVPPFYDSLLGKLIVHAANRELAIERMQLALQRFSVIGVPTTIPFHLRVLSHPDFAAGRITTRWVEEKLLVET